MILAIPAAWVSSARMDAVSSVSSVMPKREASTGSVAVPAEVRRLQLEILRLEDEKRALEGELAKASSFGRRVDVAKLELGRFVECAVIGHSVNWQEQSFLIDRGSDDGVVVRAGCLDGGAAVGIVVEVGPRVSRVAMLGEPGVRIAARSLETRRSGLVVGSGGGCELRHVPRWSPSEERPRTGEQVLTSGRLGFFPPGFLIGRIGSVGEVPESLHLNVAVVPDVTAPPSGRVWVLRPLPHDVAGEDGGSP